MNLNEDVGGNLSVVNPTESHHSEETLSKLRNKVTSTFSQSEIFFQSCYCRMYVLAFHDQYIL